MAPKFLNTMSGCHQVSIFSLFLLTVFLVPILMSSETCQSLKQIDCQGHRQGEISCTGTKQILMVKLHRGCALPFRKPISSIIIVSYTYKITHALYIYAKHFVCPSHKVNISFKFMYITHWKSVFPSIIFVPRWH